MTRENKFEKLIEETKYLSDRERAQAYWAYVKIDWDEMIHNQPKSIMTTDGVVYNYPQLLSFEETFATQLKEL